MTQVLSAHIMPMGWQSEQHLRAAGSKAHLRPSKLQSLGLFGHFFCMQSLRSPYLQKQKILFLSGFLLNRVNHSAEVKRVLLNDQSILLFGSFSFFLSFYFLSSLCAQFCFPLHVPCFSAAFPAFWEVHWHLCSCQETDGAAEVPSGPGGPDTNSLAAAPASTRQLGKHNLTNICVIHPHFLEMGLGTAKDFGEIPENIPHAP